MKLENPLFCFELKQFKKKSYKFTCKFMLNKNGLCQIVKTNFNYFKVYIMIIFWAQDSVYVASIVVVHVFIESEGKQLDKQQIHVYNNTKLHVKLACI